LLIAHMLVGISDASISLFYFDTISAIYGVCLLASVYWHYRCWRNIAISISMF